MTFTDKATKAAANHKVNPSGYLLPLFVSHSAALSEIEVVALHKWHKFMDNLEEENKKIFHNKSGFKPSADSRVGSTFLRLRPAKWFKSIDAPPCPN